LFSLFGRNKNTRERIKLCTVVPSASDLRGGAKRRQPGEPSFPRESEHLIVSHYFSTTGILRNSICNNAATAQFVRQTIDLKLVLKIFVLICQFTQISLEVLVSAKFQLSKNYRINRTICIIFEQMFFF
jgi:hypothetical protein